MVDQSGSKPKRLWRIVLVVSLALNLIVVGVVAGAAFSGRIGKGPPRAFDLGLGPLARTLDPQDRRAISSALRQDNELRRLDVRDQIAAMIAALRQEPFDPDGLRAVIAERNNRVVQLQTKAQSVLIDQISAMTPLRREQFADRLERELSRPRAPHDRRSGG